MSDSFVTSWTVAHQVPLSMGFPKHEYCGGLPFPSPGDLPDPWIEPGSPALHEDSFSLSQQGTPSVQRAVCVCVLVPPLCLTLCDTKDYSQPGSSVHGFLHARILEWLPISFSRGSSQPKDQTLISCIAGWFFTIWATREDPWETRAAHIECYLWYKRNILNHK